MNLDPYYAGLIRRYLLGQLLPDEQTEIEQRLLSDSDFFQEIVIGEEELIDDYVTHQLTDSEIQAFDTHFLVTDERRKQLRFASRLAEYLDESNETEVDEAVSESPTGPSSTSFVEPGRKRSFFSFFPTLSPALSYSFAAVMLLAFVGIMWLAEMNKTTPSGEPGSLLAVTLTPGLTRDGGETTRVKLLNETGRIEFRVILPTAEYQTYRTRLITDSKSELWASDDLTPVKESGTQSTAVQVVVSTVPARLLTPGDYRIALSGRANNGVFEDVASYPFRVVR